MGGQVKTNTAQQTAKKTREQHKPLHTHKCRYCGAEIDQNAEFCPVCGKKLADYCTFCGAPMAPTDTVCEECGMPANGVVCPKCGTLNVRSFCRHCNTPLTKAAMRVVEKAKEDPKVKKVASLMDRAAELEQQLGDAVPHVTEGEHRLEELLNGKVEFASADTDQTQAMEEYRQVVKDINQLFEEMLPPAGSTPQEQYNYYSARKVAVESIRKVQVVSRTGWVCNYCGCFHHKPSECCEPWHGGTWIYKTIEREEVVKDYRYEE